MASAWVVYIMLMSSAKITPTSGYLYANEQLMNLGSLVQATNEWLRVNIVWTRWKCVDIKEQL